MSATILDFVHHLQAGTGRKGLHKTGGAVKAKPESVQRLPYHPTKMLRKEGAEGGSGVECLPSEPKVLGLICIT